MICDDVRAKLTAYLDGELEDNRGSAIRGHLRGCEACRHMAADEAALRDGLRSLPPLDPPNALWSGIQRRLAAEEVADSDQPAWRRALSRFAARWRPLAPQLALGSAALAVAVVVLAVHHRASTSTSEGPVAAMPELPRVAPPHVAPQPQPPAAIEGDVTAELADDAVNRTASFRQAAEELVEPCLERRAAWTDDRKAVFDAKLAAFRKQAAAANGRARDRIYLDMRSYLHGVAIRDEVTANDRKFAATRGLP